MKITAFLLFALLAGQLVHAQQNRPMVFEKVPGLSQNTVYCIAQDKQGFMWIGTADGLNRFDGKIMEVFKPLPDANNEHLPGRMIRHSIYEDAQSKFWFSTEVSLFSYDKKRGRYRKAQFKNDLHGTTEFSVNPLFETNNVLWSVNGYMGAVSYNTVTGEAHYFPIKGPGGAVINIQDQGVSHMDGMIYAGGMGGLYRFNTKEGNWQKLISGDDISFTAVKKDTVFYSQGSQLYFLSLKTGSRGKVQKALKKSDAAIRCLYVDQKDNLWVGDMEGNIFLKPAMSSTLSWRGNINPDPDAKPAYPVYALCVSESGVLFAGGDVVGLFKADLNRYKFHVYPDEHNSGKLGDLFVTSIAENSKGNIVVGTYEGGLHTKEPSASSFEPVKIEMTGPHQSFNAKESMVHTDANGNYWLCYGNKLFVAQVGTSNYEKIELQLPPASFATSVKVFSVIPWEQGWYLGTNAGLWEIKKMGGKYNVNFIASIGQTAIRSLWLQAKNQLWLGLESGGVLIIDPERNYEVSGGFLEGAGIKSFLPDSAHDIVWISTMSGLVSYHIASRTKKIFTEKDGLSNSFIYGVLQHDNQLWIATNRGLTRATLQFQKGENHPTAIFVTFTSRDGLPDDEFNSGAFFKDREGIFYFGTIKGVVWFRPQEIVLSTLLPKVVFTSVRTNNENADSTVTPEFMTHLTVPYSKHNLDFAFQALEYRNVEVVEYAYQLVGWDNGWVNNKGLNEARYSNLPPGKYVFQVKAKRRAGIWTEIRKMDIIIKPPFYLTYWFYSLVALLVIGSIILITRNIAQQKLHVKIEELERQKALDIERLRISREMHDDIGAGLTQITLMSEAVKSSNADQHSKELDDIADTSRLLVSNMNEIIWSLNPENKTLDQLFGYMREQLGKLLEYSGFEYAIRFPENVQHIILTNEERRNILLAAKEIVHNAVKHSQGQTIIIEAVIIKNGVRFKITDDGIGYDFDAESNGNGKRNIAFRIQEIGGTFNIYPTTGAGTTFVFEVPLPFG